MAQNAKKMEHSGSKKGRGAYFGRKAVAKHESNKGRRRYDRQLITKQLEVFEINKRS
jgi:hypothetical protein